MLVGWVAQARTRSEQQGPRTFGRRQRPLARVVSVHTALAPPEEQEQDDRACDEERGPREHPERDADRGACAQPRSGMVVIVRVRGGRLCGGWDR